MSKQKKSGLGSDVYFENLPDEVDEQGGKGTSGEEASERPSPPVNSRHKEQKIRRTFVIKQHTQKALEGLRIEGLIKGEKITLSELLDEAVELLMEKKKKEANS